MTIEKAILSAKEPKETNTAWIQPKGDSLQLNIFNNGKWRPINGNGGSSSSSSSNSSEGTAWPVDPNAPMLSMNNIFTQMDIIAERLDISSQNPTLEQREQIFNELKSYKFATPKQGNAVLLDYDLDNRIITFQCDDGSIITFTSDHGIKFITGLRPDIDGYIIWKTTKDKLPVRESQEEPNPGGSLKSVKSGLLGEQPPTDPSTEVVYTVMNNNTGEIVDPLELHKLTNVIYSFDQTNCHPCYLINALHNVENLPPSIQGSAVPISIWRDMSVPSTTQKYYYNYIINSSGATAPNT